VSKDVQTEGCRGAAAALTIISRFRGACAVKHFGSAVLSLCLAVVMSTAALAAVPRVLKPRLVLGDPIWRELPVRADLQTRYDRVWQTAVDTALEHNFEIATMDKSSGYLRTIPKADVVRLQSDWYYKVQVSMKLVTDNGAKSDPAPVTKVRLQVSGEVSNVDPRRGLRESYTGYDQIILQNLFQDLQAKLGSL
jgi:hypothetical protein